MKVFLKWFKLTTYILCLGFLLPQLGIAQVQSYPNKPIRLIVPFPPGGVTDIMARAMATKMSESMNTQIVIDNKAGASGALGAEMAAKSAPDGYTWLMGNISSLGINPATMAKLGYDPVKSFEPAGMVAIQPLVITVNSQLPIKTLSELVQWAKVHPGELNYGTAGSSVHLAVEYFDSLADIKMNHIPYKGSSPAITDILGGQIQVLFDPFSSVYPHVASGKLRALAITTKNRSSQAPQLPTVIESGYPGYDVSSWQGIVLPAGTPKTIIQKVNQEINKALASAEIKSKFDQYSAEPTQWSPEQYGNFIKEENIRWLQIAKNANIKPE